MCRPRALTRRVFKIPRCAPAFVKSVSRRRARGAALRPWRHARLGRRPFVECPKQLHSDILIIGAGPAGLALGYHLRQRRIDFRILERGPAPGESWRSMPTTLRLISPWKSNRLPADKTDWPANYAMKRDEFLQYLQNYAAEHRLPITPDAE